MSDEYPEITEGTILARKVRESYQKQRASSLAAPARSVDTACSNCKAEMPEVPKPNRREPINTAKIIITAYRCQFCGHWNDLKRRKSWRKNEKGQP